MSTWCWWSWACAAPCSWRTRRCCPRRCRWRWRSGRSLPARGWSPPPPRTPAPARSPRTRTWSAAPRLQQPQTILQTWQKYLWTMNVPNNISRVEGGGKCFLLSQNNCKLANIWSPHAPIWTVACPWRGHEKIFIEWFLMAAALCCEEPTLNELRSLVKP